MGIDVIATVTLLHALNTETYSQKQLQEITGMHHASIGGWLRALKRKKLIYIAEWHRHGKIWVAYYQWGIDEKDAPKPKPMTDAEYSRRARQAKALKALHASNVILNERKSI